MKTIHCVPRELMYLHGCVSKSGGIYILENESLRQFRESRRNEFLKAARNYTEALSDSSYLDYRKALSIGHGKYC